MWDYAIMFALTSVQTQALLRILTSVIAPLSAAGEKE
jgi:hypothetical protein